MASGSVAFARAGGSTAPACGKIRLVGPGGKGTIIPDQTGGVSGMRLGRSANQRSAPNDQLSIGGRAEGMVSRGTRMAAADAELVVREAEGA